MKVYYWTILFGLLIFVNATQGLYLTHALAGEVCAHEPTCLQNLPHHLKRFDRKIFLQRPTRSDRFVSTFSKIQPMKIGLGEIEKLLKGPK